MDVGGGLGIVYKDETLIDTYEYTQSILDVMFGLDLTVICEPGRFIVGNSGVFGSSIFFAKKSPLSQTTHNDLIAIYSAGAYGFTMASNYNTRGRVAEIAVENGVDRLIRRRETFEDLIALEEEFIK